MDEYLLLVAPSANRVYADAAPRLVAAEVQIVATAMLGVPVPEPRLTAIGGVDYLVVELPDLPAALVDALGAVSGRYALFRRHGDPTQQPVLLEPVTVTAPDRFPTDLITIQKYQGKTNEQLTRLLFNITAMASRFRGRLVEPGRRSAGGLTVLDPLCGRGTTLHQAMTYGHDVVGVDLDQRDFDAYVTFLTTWLKTHRIKHKATTGALRVAGRHHGRRFEVELSSDKAGYREGEVQRIRYLGTDTRELEPFLKAGSVDLVVTDTPYGVAHGSHGDRLVRSPAGLIRDALPGWVRVLRRGGAIGMAINRHVISRDDLEGLLSDHGLTPVTSDGYDRLRHRVDASIDRDLVVATKS